eukprot:CAMPEP_0198425696 /NCGR_PEP_ID=MMETSP1452-20131203/4740_1 /TAXON_ID=1181717 /ORGANISM="Synchroma pusillum, Strain CCMP3072" /LENGTH=246 /DNA_ID=CAMNT_0044146055 /DNA_START=113 /DNA_END=851 /DNA_ORIENTATION=+
MGARRDPPHLRVRGGGAVGWEGTDGAETGKGDGRNARGGTTPGGRLAAAPRGLPLRRALGLHHAKLDAVPLARCVVHAPLDLLQDVLRRLNEGRLHVGSRLRGRLQKDEPVGLRELPSLLVAHRAPVLQVRLVSDEHDRHVRVAVLPRLLQPPRQVVEALSPGNVVHEERPGCVPVVRARDGAEALLPSRVPHLRLDAQAVHVEHARAELHANGQVMHGLEALVRELEQQAGLAHARVADDNVLEQ